MPTIHLLRHGHVHNPGGVLYGRLPGFRLSEAGEQMARAATDHLKAEGRDVAQVVSSPLLRARQTAGIVAEAFELDVVEDERLIEAGNAFEGELLRPAIRFVLPHHWWRLRNPFRPSWGEPYDEQRDRMTAAVLEAAQREPEGDSVLVSHQLPIWVMRLSAEGRRFGHLPRSRRCSLASLTSLTVEHGEVVGVAYTEPAAHVEVKS